MFLLPLAFGAALQPTLLRAITFMIVASPCAVVLATMPPLLSAIANAGRHGVLVKSAVVMEQLGLTDTVAFDKTGTLTEGTPRVTNVQVLTDAPLSERELLRVAAAAERPSEHPLAAAITAAAHEAGIDLPEARAFTSAPGQGVRAEVDGHTVRVGSPTVLDELSPALAGRRSPPKPPRPSPPPKSRPAPRLSWSSTAPRPGCWPWRTGCVPTPRPPSRACRHSPETRPSC